jgi:hypothetical protein
MNRNYLCIILSLLVLTFYCAVVESPSGGPVDSQPPQVQVLILKDEISQIADKQEFTIQFSERMELNAIKSSINFYPSSVEVEYDWNWNFNQLTIKPKTKWSEEFPITMLIGPILQDYHKVQTDTLILKYLFTRDFETNNWIRVIANSIEETKLDSIPVNKDSTDTVRQVYTIGLLFPKQDADVLKDIPEYKSFSASDTLDFKYLRDNQQWVCLAFKDFNRSLKWDVKEEPAVLTTIVLEKFNQSTGTMLNLGYTRIIGKVSGLDTGKVFVNFYSVSQEIDSFQVKSDSTFSFSSQNLFPYPYIIKINADVNANNKIDSSEAIALYTDTVLTSLGTITDIGIIPLEVSTPNEPLNILENENDQ